MQCISISWMLQDREKTPQNETFEERLRIYQREADKQHTKRIYYNKDKGA